MPRTSPPITSRILASVAHSCSGRSPTTVRATLTAGSSVSAWSSTPTVTPPRTVTRPELGVSRPASIAIRLDLPSPLRPTTPIRSPSLTPTLTESKTTFVGNSRCSDSAPSRCATPPA